MRIGIPATSHDEKFGVNTNYLEFILNFGTPVIIAPCKVEEFYNIYKLDAIILPGGKDVEQSRYNSFSFLNGIPDKYLEYFDRQILPILIGELPIFGICRGLQTLNVHFGGTLRNLFYHRYSMSETDEVHKVNIPGTKKSFGVNSFHHQGIAKLADNLKIEALSTDNIIEAVSDIDNKIFAVQWHPERLNDEYSINKFNLITNL